MPAAYIEAVADLADTCGRVCHLAVYADWREQGNRGAWGTTIDLGGVPKQIMKAGGANSADISIVVDAMETLLLAPTVDVFVLATGDSDFVPLIQRLRAAGKLVVGAAPAYRSIRPALESAFDRFERLRDPSEDAPAAKARAPAASPSQARGEPSVLSLDQTRKTLVEILSREGSLTASEIGNLLRDALPGFDQRALGFRQLSDFLRAQSDLISVMTDGSMLHVRLVPSPRIAAAAATSLEPAPPPQPKIERTEWTQLRDHLLAVMLAPGARPQARDDELAAAMSELAKKSSATELPNVPIADIVAHYPSCFVRAADGTAAPAIGLADAYKLRLGRVWEPLARDVMRRALALLPEIVGRAPAVTTELPSRLADAANGELTQAQARHIVNMIRRAEGWVTTPPDADGKPRVRAKDWVVDPGHAESRLDEEALARMGPFLPVDPHAMALALGIREGEAEVRGAGLGASAEDDVVGERVRRSETS